MKGKSLEEFNQKRVKTRYSRDGLKFNVINSTYVHS
jgi:hypothetical protein